MADQFIVTDIQAGEMGAAVMERETVACGWDEKISVLSGHGISVTFL